MSTTYDFIRDDRTEFSVTFDDDGTAIQLDGPETLQPVLGYPELCPLAWWLTGFTRWYEIAARSEPRD
jgi:hypothetical protein